MTDPRSTSHATTAATAAAGAAAESSSTGRTPETAAAAHSRQIWAASSMSSVQPLLAPPPGLGYQLQQQQQQQQRQQQQQNLQQQHHLQQQHPHGYQQLPSSSATIRSPFTAISSHIPNAAPGSPSAKSLIASNSTTTASNASTATFSPGSSQSDRFSSMESRSTAVHQQQQQHRHPSPFTSSTAFGLTPWSPSLGYSPSMATPFTVQRPSNTSAASSTTTAASQAASSGRLPSKDTPIDDPMKSMQHTLGFLGIDDDDINEADSRMRMLQEQKRAFEAIENDAAVVMYNSVAPSNDKPTIPLGGISVLLGGDHLSARTGDLGMPPAYASPEKTPCTAGESNLSVVEEDLHGNHSDMDNYDSNENSFDDHDDEEHDTTLSLTPTPAMLMRPQNAPIEESTTVQSPKNVTNETRHLWIGNFDATLSESDLITAFERFGTIESVRAIPARECAFVNFSTVEAAVAAYEAMSGARLGNCVIQTNFGKPETKPTETVDAESRQRPKKYQSSADDPAHAIPSRALWIGNLPSNTEAQFLLDLFSPYGVIESTRTVPSKNCGFCNFYTVADAVRARDALQGHRIGGTALRIGFGKAQALHGEDLIRAVTLEARQEKERREAEMRTHASAAAVAANEAYKTIAADSSAIIPAKRREGSRSITPSQQQEKTSTPITYLDTVPPLPYLLGAPPRDESEPYHKMNIAHLKDIRRKLEHSSGVSSLEIAGWIKECLPQIVELSTDLHGNTVIQKLIDRATDQQRLMLLQKAAPHLAAIAMHKNGTYVVQKMMEYAVRSPTQAQLLISSIRRYTPALIVDPYANYVIQSCLTFGAPLNQFVFDVLATRSDDICHSKFGARAMRACLESKLTSEGQKKQVAAGMVQSALTLATNPNGVLLLNWLLDESALPGRYRILASKFAPRAAFLINQKPAQGILSRIVQQTVEPEALDLLAFEGLCAREETLASAVLNTPRPRDDGSGYPSEVSAGLFLKLLQAYDEQGRREECRRLATRLDKVLRKYVPHVVEAAHHLGAQDRVRQLVMAVAAFL